ncbi:uncharacterized protein LY79DRAFT_659578 [Colletotrichum navitas]|uniref:Uncharacterized protein n=1 Tax=Colletotrichum navitas TaxID=681940 RepID=A0AAD8PYD7_9PEZI|nr:uncharacterized protein LY79DRAFT_659578 [Colletotrichum navitas]KAK1590291.1 hypothetical protein LY79DRAFT_659578 [Colletotrichum navitas]
MSWRVWWLRPDADSKPCSNTSKTSLDAGSPYYGIFAMIVLIMAGDFCDTHPVKQSTRCGDTHYAPKAAHAHWRLVHELQPRNPRVEAYDIRAIFPNRPIRALEIDQTPEERPTYIQVIRQVEIPVPTLVLRNKQAADNKPETVRLYEAPVQMAFYKDPAFRPRRGIEPSTVCDEIAYLTDIQRQSIACEHLVRLAINAAKRNLLVNVPTHVVLATAQIGGFFDIDEVEVTTQQVFFFYGDFEKPGQRGRNVGTIVLHQKLLSPVDCAKTLQVLPSISTITVSAHALITCCSRDIKGILKAWLSHKTRKTLWDIAQDNKADAETYERCFPFLVNAKKGHCLGLCAELQAILINPESVIRQLAQPLSLELLLQIAAINVSCALRMTS